MILWIIVVLEALKNILSFSFELFSAPIFFFSFLFSFFFWVRTHVDHHAFYSRGGCILWPKTSSQLVFIIKLPHSWQQDETMFSAAFHWTSISAQSSPFIWETSLVGSLERGPTKVVFFTCMHCCKDKGLQIQLSVRTRRDAVTSSPTLTTEQCTHSIIIAVL